MDYRNNVKQNDGDINSFLYSPGESGSAQKYALPRDPGSGPAYMTQAMNRPQSSYLKDANNAGEKMAMLNRLKEQTRAQYEKKKMQFGANKRTGVLNLGGSMALEAMNLDRKADFQGTHSILLTLATQRAKLTYN